MAINLNILQKANPKITIDGARPQERQKDEFTFRDIKFDLELGEIKQTNEFGIKNNIDVRANDDLEAIEQSIKNILNTTPGEKILNPFLGLDLKQFLFDPITQQTGDTIARAIYSGLGEQEPRITITKVQVTGNVEDESYEIVIAILIPSLNNRGGVVTGNLGADGFKFKN